MTDTNKNIGISELANTPREVTIGDSVFKIRQLNLKEVFGAFESSIRSQKLKEANEWASTLSGTEKGEFLAAAWKLLPAGSELTLLCSDMVSTFDGVCDILYMACVDFDAKLTKDKISELISLKSLKDFAPMVNWIIGMEENTDLSVEESTEKKT